MNVNRLKLIIYNLNPGKSHFIYMIENLKLIFIQKKFKYNKKQRQACRPPG